MNRFETDLKLGLDLGSVSLNCVITDSQDRIIYKNYRRTSGRPIERTIELFKEIESLFGNISFSGAVVAGSGKELIAKPAGLYTVNEIVAHATAAWTVYPDVESVFEIGGQDSKYISIGKTKDGRHFLKDHAFNELCAAGTGAFLDQQAVRLGLTIQELSEKADKAENVASVAGRCSVFAKSDMIHLQQKAVSIGDICAGLCFALARNYLATLCRGHIPPAPVIFQGGVAANKGVIRAFREILKLNENELIIPEFYDVMGAYGSAIIAKEQQLESPVEIRKLIELLEKRSLEPESDSTLENLTCSGIETADILNEKSFEQPFFMGIDVGSVSTKGAVIDSKKNIVASSYLPTAGRPVEALRDLVSSLKREIGSDILISNIVCTGSGRHLASALFDKGSIMDEISAQSVSSSYYFPEADTIIEIGGQDSKFIKMSGGKMLSFKMNRACAAGTGSFLEEQAGRLGISIKDEFAERAFKSENPLRLGSRCTVFMDSDLVHHLQRGALTEDLCAGLAYSIGENYLEKVVGSAEIGSSIVFQGGVAKNPAVKAVFERLLKKPVNIHPFPEISGAIGAAITALDDYDLKKEDQSFSLNEVVIEAVTDTFECKLCENICEIRKVTVKSGHTAYFGSVCGRFEKSADSCIQADDLFSVREKLMHDCVKSSEVEPFRGEIAIPMTLTMSDYLPFWQTFFNKLGFKTYISGNTTRSMVESGLIHVPAEFCYPVKVLFGHVYNLGDLGKKKIFIPHLRFFTPPKEVSKRYACPYTQAAPYVVRENISFDAEIMTLEYPVDGEEKYWIDYAAKELDIEKNEIKQALRSANSAQHEFGEKCLEEGRKIISILEKENRRGSVLLGRPYNTTDRFVNLNLVRRLKEQNIEPIPFDFLPMGEDRLPELWSRIRWGYGRKLVQTARVLKKHKFLGAVIVTNFGCGPDSFVDQYLEYELKEVPHIILEFDDHQAEAGLITRLEAFSRNFKISEKSAKRIEGRDPGKPRIPLREYTYYIPSFMEHAYAITGALKASGCKTVLLPPTDEESWNLGLKYAYGRECHPFISFTGDILKAAQDPDFVPEKACYFGPSYFGACLLPQYLLALHLILERIGLEDITVMNVTDETNMKELGWPYMIRLALGVYTIDRFFKWKTEIELYEAVPGEVNKVYKEIILDLEKGLAEGSFFKILRKSVKRFKAVALTEKDGTKPKIGIVGDVYTRVNEHSNDHLYSKLKEMGYEVWTSCSLIDISFMGMEQLHVELSRKGNKIKSFFTRIMIPGIKVARWLIDRYFPENIRTPQERNYHAIKNVVSKYADVHIDKALALNINRVEEFQLAGADGVINVMCHNCMLGNVTASLTKSMRKDMDDIPICNLVYEGLKSTHNINRLEAFTHQVNSCKKCK
ncbi:MAG TPA: acyl-CoA dehydratase activase [bacterium]|nr:acyl-CoA dehydratase activase [bacterium]